ncbi:glycosyltransferase family 4 protein [Bacteroides fragilis]|uniref:glycosyltransferase family 4 protein n=1 Tax=Bacteroides TaxID=816 RepID=UPI001896BF8C|nr:glycosyltransferase family 4 protein [Bacteroides fragilis]MCE8624142.1 glycosyltransferase family 4 protein [Bacteroides fragilis]MCE8700103.1 glycosyltransferase family 4 protein [Bacteroides fragilis]MCE8702924.1 glycosyltransferase family 4 protein [Bacteroides fragilis]MCE9326817.1 glycosyltransferase family 4 protein [Bacteroides fragilis]MCE9445667.1 glycosyltransferase family 4 protein [Bacteroides fragilis]
MKIIYYIPALYGSGGMERIITFKANYLAEHWEESEIYILTSEQIGRPIHYDLSPKVKHLDLNVPFDWPFNQSHISKSLRYPYRYWLFKKRFSRTLKELCPDFTISTLRRELNFISSIRDGSIKIGEFHFTRHCYGIGKKKQEKNIIELLKIYWAKMFLKHLKSLSKLVILTHEEVNLWPELSNLYVIPNPIATFGNQLSDCSQKQVMAAGRYSDEKGFDLLIETWAIVSPKHPDWTLRIYGDGGLRTKLQRQIDQAGIGQTCFLEPTTARITEKYCESSIFVLSSRYEGFGMVITEAMACGVPPVSFACPCGPRDIIEHGLNGLLAQPEDINDLATQINDLIEHEDKRKEMGRNARIRSERFRMETIAQEWKTLFETLKNNEKVV